MIGKGVCNHFYSLDMDEQSATHPRAVTSGPSYYGAAPSRVRGAEDHMGRWQWHILARGDRLVEARNTQTHPIFALLGLSSVAVDRLAAASDGIPSRAAIGVFTVSTWDRCVFHLSATVPSFP